MEVLIWTEGTILWISAFNLVMKKITGAEKMNKEIGK